MKTRIKLLFRIVEYRRLCIKVFILRIWDIISTPFDYIDSAIWCWKFNRDHPNRWERYVLLKEMEQKEKENDRLYEIASCKIHFTGATTNMTIIMIGYIASYVRPEEMKEYKQMPLDELKRKFRDNKKNALKSLAQLQDLCDELPPELFELVKQCYLDSYKDPKDVQDYFAMVNSYLEGVGCPAENR